MCVCSNSRNDVPRVAQRYGTIAAHTRRRASVLVVFVVFCVHMYSFAGLIRRTPPPTFSDTAITDRHSDTTISSSELTGCGYPGLLDRKNRSDMCPRWDSNPRLPACKASTLSTRPGSPPFNPIKNITCFFIIGIKWAWLCYMKNSVLIGQILSVNFMATKIKTNKMITMTKASVTSSIVFIEMLYCLPIFIG